MRKCFFLGICFFNMFHDARWTHFQTIKIIAITDFRNDDVLHEYKGVYSNRSTTTSSLHKAKGTEDEEPENGTRARVIQSFSYVPFSRQSGTMLCYRSWSDRMACQVIEWFALNAPYVFEKSWRFAWKSPELQDTRWTAMNNFDFNFNTAKSLEQFQNFTNDCTCRWRHTLHAPTTLGNHKQPCRISKGITANSFHTS